MNRKDFFWKFAYLMMAGGIFLIDQMSKAWIVRHLNFDSRREIIPGFLNFIYAYNPGVAFSMFDESGDAGRWGLSVVAGIAAILVLYYFWRTSLARKRLLGALALLLAGICGNLIDRVRFGFVIDFIDMQFGSRHFSIFNVADMSICIGAGLLILDMFLSKNDASPVEFDPAKNVNSE